VEKIIYCNKNDFFQIHDELVWNHALKGLPFTENSILLTESPLNSSSNRQKITEHMFESFDTVSLCIANQATLSLLASGRTTGVVVDSGYDVTSIIPIQKGAVISRAITQMDIGGNHLTEFTKQLVSGRNTVGSPVLETMLRIKESRSHVVMDFEMEMQKMEETTEITFSYNPEYKESDFTLKLGNELFLCPEALSTPFIG
jgi:actin-related protein